MRKSQWNGKIETSGNRKIQESTMFSGIKYLPVTYKNNSNSWMIGNIFVSWLHEIDAQFQKDNRKVCLLIDNCPCHPKILERDLSNIELVFLPENTTSVVLRVDQGVIKNFKHYYRERVVMRCLSNFESGVKKDINLL